MIERRKGLSFGAVFVSLGMHVVAMVGFGVYFKPDPPKHNPMPKSQMSIQSQAVKRIAARAEPTVSEPLDESAPSARAAQQTAIKQSKARPVDLAQNPLPAQSPKSLKTTAIAPKSPSVDALRSKAPVAEAMDMASQSLAAKQMPSQSIGVTLARSTAAIAVSGATSTLQTVALSVEATATTEPAALSAFAAAVPLPSEKGRASLAWTGGAEDTVEPVSLAAIQAFMQPGDVDQSASNIGELRDGIGAILASVPCARLQTTFIPETGQLELRGHIPEDALRGPILAALSAEIGGAIPVSDQLLILPRPQCGALSQISNVGLPQSTEQLTNPRVIGADGFAQNYTYVDGQRLELDLVAPDYDSYVYVDYFAADGSVIHLQPNRIVPLEFVAAKAPLSVGRDRADKPSLDITVSPPFGQEIAAAFATSQPLYDEARPLQEPAGPYLEFLKERVRAARERDRQFKGEWVYFFISTQAQ